jgi:hypothetical protein
VKADASNRSLGDERIVCGTNAMRDERLITINDMCETRRDEPLAPLSRRRADDGSVVIAQPAFALVTPTRKRHRVAGDRARRPRRIDLSAVASVEDAIRANAFGDRRVRDLSSGAA